MRGAVHPRARLVPELLHPLRLSIVAKIAACHSIVFRDLRDVLEVTDATLSKHCAILEAAGLVAIAKSFVGKTPRTRLSMRSEGDAKWNCHRIALCEIIGVDVEPFLA
ncbi:transcriptional regulator [Rathayibacter tritici]|uniref:transcriptional regulator n=1 Tax=Rathayibacter tritici TaxID=33888 RepID=UPI000A07A2C0|nr:transcriptional regulator [Rathayibacter tritici]PPI49371.1 ArsR family transcriptional regulator [Rathayibacter tritici]